MAPSQESLVGRVLDDTYEIVRQIGAGGMGAVYLARHRALEVPRAVKVITTGDQRREMFTKRFRREALALAELKHPNIVQIISLGQLEGGENYLVMEYLEGPTLREVVSLEGPLPLTEALEVLVQLAAALDHAHGHQIVHRDLKPANVILQNGTVGAVKVFDFGVAKLLSADGLTNLTQAGDLIGTPMYMAPEQCAAATVTGAADVYALGGIAYTLLSGRPVFTAESTMGYLFFHRQHAPEPLDVRCPDAGIPPALRDLLLSCLAKAPEERPSAKALEVKLEEQLREARRRATSAPPPMRASADGSPLPWSLTLLARASQPPPPEGSDPQQTTAQLIWADPQAGCQVGAAGDASSAAQEGLCNQLGAALVELAAELAEEPGAPATLSEHLEQLDAIGASLAELELELALSETRLVELGGDGARGAAAASLKDRCQQLDARGLALHRLRHRQLRALYPLVVGLRPLVSDPELDERFVELDALISEYLRCARCSVP